MNNSAAMVGEIFREAGTAFNKLSEMTLMLQPMDGSPPGGKWSDAEVEMLRGCINRFAVELNKISQHIKDRTMRHLKILLEKDSDTIPDTSNSPQQPQHFTQQPPPALENILETEYQIDFDESLLNIFADNNMKMEEIDDIMHHVHRTLCESPPVDIMEGGNQQQPADEFEDSTEDSRDITLQAVPSLISMLDADVNKEMPHSERRLPTETMAIGTLHAEQPNYEFNLADAAGASRSVREFNENRTDMVLREEQFSLCQAVATWDTLPLLNNVLYPGFFNNYSLNSDRSGSVQVRNDEQNGSSRSLFANKLLNANNEPIVASLQAQTNFSSILPDTNEQALESSAHHTSRSRWRVRPNPYGNYLYSSNPVPILPSLQAQTNFSSILPDTNEQALESSAHRTSRSRRRVRPNPYGNDLYNTNPAPILPSLQAQTNFSSILPNTNEQALTSSAHQTSRSQWRGRPNPHGNDFSANHAPILPSLLAQNNFNSILPDTNEQALASSAHRTSRSRWRGRPNPYGNDSYNGYRAPILPSLLAQTNFSSFLPDTNEQALASSAHRFCG